MPILNRIMYFKLLLLTVILSFPGPGTSTIIAQQKDTIRFSIRDTSLLTGDTIQVWMSSPDPMMFSGIQMGLEYDSLNLKIISFSSPTIPSSDIKASYDNHVHKLFIFNSGGNNLSIEKNWLKMTIVSAVNGRLSDYLSQSKSFKSFYIDTDLEDFPLKITIEKTTYTQNEPDIQRFFAYPVPCKDKLFVLGNRYEMANIDVSLLDETGRPIPVKVQPSPGSNQLYLYLDNNIRPGIYYIILKQKQQSVIKRIIKY